MTDSSPQSACPESKHQQHYHSDREDLEPTEVNVHLVRKQAYTTYTPSDRQHRTFSATDHSESSFVDYSRTHTSSSSPKPQIIFKPKHSRTVYPMISDATSRRSPHIGAVTNLAIDGGVSPEQLLRIGSVTIGTSASSVTGALLAKPNFVSTTTSQSTSPPYTSQLIDQTRRHRPNRPTYCSKAQIVATNQPIQLNRTGLHLDYSNSYQTSHVRISPLWSARSRGVRMGVRRGSFPGFQMTRVGGLIFNPTVSSSLDNPPVPAIPFSNDFAPYRSASACTSPGAVGKHTVTTATASSSPQTNVFFSSSDIPDSSHALSLSSIPVTSAATTGSLVCQSDNANEADIVRLGPGDTVTRDVPGSCNRTVLSLVRMRYCPQPYVSRSDASILETVSQRSHAPSSLSSPIDITTTSPLSCLSPLSDSTCTSLPFSAPPAPIYTGTLHLPTGSPDNSSPVSAHLYHRCDIASKRPKPVVHSSPTGAQLARTVRHLRRIRHIYGDSLSYVNSGTSASLGALTASGHDSSTECVVGGSLSELRNHTPGKSVNYVYPVCITCGECSIDSGPLFSSRRTRRPDSAPISGSTTTAHIRYTHSPSKCVCCWSPWEECYLSMSGDVLIISLTRWQQEQLTDSDTRNDHDPLAHVHLRLSRELSPQWSSVRKFPVSELPMIIPSSDDVSQAPSEAASSNEHTAIVGTLRIPDENATCQLYFTDRQIASDLFGGVWAPPYRDENLDDTVLTEHSSLAASKSRVCSDISHQPSRSKHCSGRSVSLGLAGPPGPIPLFRAVGTAAASVGMPRLGQVNLTTWLQAGFNKSTKSPTTSPATQIEPNGTVAQIKVDSKNSETLTSTIISDSVKQAASKIPLTRSPINRGRFHHVFSRMRRTVAASGDIGGTGKIGKRFAFSSHGALFGTKSSASTTPMSISPPATDFDELARTEVESLSSGHRMISGELASAVTATTKQMPLLLAESVSPSMPLQSPCMTLVQSIDSGVALTSTEDKRDSSPLQSRSIRQKTDKRSLSPSITTTNTDVFNYVEPSSIGVGQVSGTISRRESGGITAKPPSEADSNDPITVKTIKRPQTSQSSFVPLPFPLTGPIPLHKCPRSTLSPFVPFVVELCVTLVERFGLNCVGIYRLSGSKLAHDFISTELGKKLADIDVDSDKWNDIHAVCGMLKTFLRKLPDSLFPKVMYADFLAACRITQRERRLLSIQRLLGIMECYPHHPEYRAHRATLRYLATHLARVSAREAVNKMTTYNLALVFAPNLVQPCEDSPELLMSDSKYKIMLVETVIKYHAWIFSPDLGLESGCSIPMDSNEDLSTSELDLTSNTSISIPTVPSDTDNPSPIPGRLEGDVQPLVADLLDAAASLPPPPSDTDLETVEEPGPSSDRPSDIAAIPYGRLRFTSIPSSSWSTATLEALGSSNMKNRPSLLSSQQAESDSSLKETVGANMAKFSSILDKPIVPRPKPFNTSQFETKLDNLRNLSQDCLNQYTTEARQLEALVAESRRHLQITVAKRLHAEQLLMEARGQIRDTDKESNVTSVTSSAVTIGTSTITSRPSGYVSSRDTTGSAIPVSTKSRQSELEQSSKIDSSSEQR